MGLDIKTKVRPGSVAYICSPSYSRGGHEEDQSSRPAQGLKLGILHLSREGGYGDVYLDSQL
jgi:hypothetical protein